MAFFAFVLYNLFHWDISLNLFPMCHITQMLHSFASKYCFILVQCHAKRIPSQWVSLDVLRRSLHSYSLLPWDFPGNLQSKGIPQPGKALSFCNYGDMYQEIYVHKHTGDIFQRSVVSRTSLKCPWVMNSNTLLYASLSSEKQR